MSSWQALSFQIIMPFNQRFVLSDLGGDFHNAEIPVLASVRCELSSHFELPAQPAIGAGRKQSPLDNAPRDRGLTQRQVRPAGPQMCATVFACVFF